MNDQPIWRRRKPAAPHFSRSVASCMVFCGAGMMIGEGVASWMNEKPYTWLCAGGLMMLLGIIGLRNTRRGNENATADDTETKDKQPS